MDLAWIYWIVMKKIPLFGYAGFVLLSISWVLNWGLEGLRTHMLFFPLWLGYILIVNAMIQVRTGSCLLTRSIGHFCFLFILSAPVWWLFEVINWRTQNWIYVGRDAFSNLEFGLWATLNFSTVIPAVFSTAELLGSLECFKPMSVKNPNPRSKHLFVFFIFFLLGWVILTGLLLFPRYCYPFVWLSLFFIIDPVNNHYGYPSLIRQVLEGNWKNIMLLGLGCLVCGFFWEFWNYWSEPKWIYDVPFVGFLKVFEMPVLGYLGYIPFSWELYALYQFIMRDQAYWMLK